GAPRPEVEERLFDLRGAGGVRAPDDDLTFRTRCARAAHRAAIRKDEAVAVRWPTILQDLDDVRDDVARALHHHRVADPDVQSLDLVRVVESRPADGRAGDLH